MRRMTIALWLGIALASFQPANAQTAASLEFCTTVQASLGLLCPNGPIYLIHDGTAGVKPFAPQTFNVLCNDADGATVVFKTLTGFVHNVLPVSTRDVHLALAIRSSDAAANWTVDTPSDQSDISLVVPDLTAQVEASSSGPGNAELELTVSFDSGNAGTLIPGTYCTTVYGTITAN